jgi:hypothetical protein
MTPTGPDHATPPELRGLPRSHYARSHAPLEEPMPDQRATPNLARLWALPYGTQAELIHTMIAEQVPECVFCGGLGGHHCHCHGPCFRDCFEANHEASEMRHMGGHEIGPLGLVKQRSDA